MAIGPVRTKIEGLEFLPEKTDSQGIWEDQFLADTWGNKSQGKYLFLLHGLQAPQAIC